MVKAARTAPSSRTLHPLNIPAAISVVVNSRERPILIQVHNRVINIISIEDEWRVVDEWWRKQPVSRDYFEVLLKGGRKVTIFRNNLSNEWWQQRYD